MLWGLGINSHVDDKPQGHKTCRDHSSQGSLHRLDRADQVGFVTRERM
jgi:hypothetical protein